MSVQSWYVHLDGNSVGPLPFNELQSLVKRSVVNQNTLVSGDGQAWHPAKVAIPSAFSDTPTAPSSTQADYFKPGERWCINTHEGKQYGPISYAELTSWLVGKRLTPSCLVRRESDSEWHRVVDVFTVGASTPSAQVPTCQRDPPPTRVS